MVGSEVLQRSTMFIALIFYGSALQRSPMCVEVLYLHSAPNGAGKLKNPGYKHFAPPEQCQSDFRAKLP